MLTAVGCLGVGCCPVPIQPESPPPPPRDFDNGLSNSERMKYYHLDEGIQYLPYDVLIALHRPVVPDKPATLRFYKMYDEGFLDRPERLGLIRDTLDPSLPPIGISISGDAGYVAMAGINCPTCHTAAIRFEDDKGRGQFIVDGGSSLFAIDRLISELAFALIGTIANPIEFSGFYARFAARRRDRLTNPRYSALSWSFEKNAKPLADAAVKAEKDELDALFKTPEFQSLTSTLASDRRTRIDRDNALQTFGRVLTERGNRFGLTNHGEPKATARTMPGRATTLRDAYPTPDDLGSAFRVYGYLVRRLIHFAGAAAYADGPDDATPSGLGRANPWAVTENMLSDKWLKKDKSAWPPHVDAPINTPQLWEFERYERVFWSGVTNSMLERNIAQGVALVTDFDWGDGDRPPTYETTISVRKLEQISEYARRIKAPAWPSFFPPIDPTLAREGEAVFKAKCEGCHQPTAAAGGPGATKLAYLDVGTDAGYTTAQLQPFGRGLFPELADWLSKTKAEAYQRESVSPAERARFELGRSPSRWITPGAKLIEARPLYGIWASAPYLHNGSVRTLRQLLEPPDKRETCFHVGSLEYDPKDLGFEDEETSFGGWGSDLRCADKKGNSNAGHTAGTDLSSRDKDALLEFLKTYSTRP